MIWTCPSCLNKIDVTNRLFPLVCSCGGIVRTDGTFHIPKPIPFQDIPSIRDGTWEKFDTDSYRREQQLISEETVRRGNAAWTSLHSYRGSTPQERAEFLSHWETTIPSSSCGCSESYQRYRHDDPPNFESDYAFFVWGVRIHNKVNEKLQRKQWSVAFAIQQWKLTQPTIDSMVAVTSLSLLPKHKEVQQECLDSWRRLGLRIVSGNTEKEIDRLQSLYDVEFAVVKPSTSYDRPTPRIFDLLRICKDRPMLMLNSDIAIYGGQHVLTDAVSSRTALIGVRNNYTGTIENASVEQWGIDAFLLYPEQVSTFPDLDFAIGQTLWDYWVPYHLERSQQKVRWIGEPYFFHQSHRVHWHKESFLIGREMIEDYYGGQVDWERWRRDRPYSKHVAT